MNKELQTHKNMRYGTTAAIIAMVLDQLHKFYMVQIYKMPGREQVIVTDFFNFVMVWNRGISFGMFQGHPYSNYFFMGFTTIIVLILFYIMKIAKSRTEALGLGIIIGGALGNLIDRFRTQAVADFFDFHYNNYHWPAFNIADSCVFIGAVLLIISSIIKKPVTNGK